MSEWKETRFGDFVVFNPRVKLTKGKEYPFILMEEIEPKVKFINSSTTKVYDGNGAKFENGDTLFARITPSLENGKIAQVSKLKRAGFGSTELYVFREKPNVSDKDFIYYTVRADFFIQNAVNSYVGASGRQRADAGFIANTILKLPDLPTQSCIASILSAYDDLIENNNRRIALLEQMAEQIYKEWFVRMRFPGYENTEFEKGVPKGWEVKKLKDIAEINKQNINSNTTTSVLHYIDISSVNKGKIENITSYSRNDAPGRAKRIIKQGDTIFSTVRPENRAFAFIINTDENTVVSTGFAVLSPKLIEFSEFLYLTISNETFIDEMSIKAKGAAYPQVGFDDVSNYCFIFPEEDNEIIEKFHSITNSLFVEIANLQLQTQTLKQTRDLLLPRLISGKLKVKDAEMETEKM